MTIAHTLCQPSTRLQVLVIASGLAALSWEVLWQIQASLALGVSALGTALTLAVTIGGMSVGALLMGRHLHNRTITQPLRLYGLLEICIGLAGLCLLPAFNAIADLDSWAYRAMPDHYPLLHITSIVTVLGVPTLCMGATFPVFGLMARQAQTSIATLYGCNTLGAAGGVLLVALAFIPWLGLLHTGWLIAGVNFLVGLVALTWRLPALVTTAERTTSTTAPSGFSKLTECALVALTGFATFALEIAWFRALTAAFHSTTDAFAIMLAAMLLALGLAGRLAPVLKRSGIALGTCLALSGGLILLATPLIERFDSVDPVFVQTGLFLMNWFAMTLCVIGPPIALLGLGLPWIMDSQQTPRRWGMLYSINTFGSILGAVGAAWLLLPTIGATRTAWLAGVLVAGAGVLIAPASRRAALAGVMAIGLLITITAESGVGRTRVLGNLRAFSRVPEKVLAQYEGPAATIAAVQYPDGHGRALVIDGFVAASQFTPKGPTNDGYMAWMGHLPMLLHPNPHDALVICFGTGQTSNAVRRENPDHLDIVDLSANVFKLAHFFDKNQNVLDDPRVKPTVMDGRAYIRRTQKNFDVITLEPMPPHFAGVNALYSVEFYQHARTKLRPDGVIAQWLPFHLVAPYYIASIVKTFQSVFPNAILWIDPVSTTGILLGTKNDQAAFGTQWPGFARNPITRGLDEMGVRQAVLMTKEQLHLFDAKATIISDDNQLLAYGDAVLSGHFSQFLLKDNLEFIGFPTPQGR